ncbi:hypothetical protein B0H15DRAFT_924433 [Mycena belliarum]|uniref:Uncharacterized protein n=1 Tax=Mycena belliarum TaxID=1033014 RepID=A0AAD6TYV8_9AGAR|nr:hypothetical protein B0H15DRAFT_924433 [Mycena belliae]
MVQVGAEMNSPGGIFQFTPNQITAPNGTTVTFQFSGSPGNHSITQSSFDSPCQPLQGGFDSGWVLITSTTPLSPLPEWNLTITNDQMPIWFYCKQLLPSPHCLAGMVGAINVQNSSANSFTAFQSNALKTSGNPGQSQNGLVGLGASASAEPFVPSGATHFPLSAAASATAPGGASGGAAPTTSSTTGDTVALTAHFNLLAILVGLISSSVLFL